jgi:hypothetical protein
MLAIQTVQDSPDQRAPLERFIAERFREVHGASVQHFCAHLLGMHDALGRWRAAAGYTPAASGRLFLEQYLDQPAEELLGAAAGTRVARASVAEVGNLAAAPGMGRLLIPAVGRHLHRLGYRWVVFTATRELRNALRRLQLEPLRLAPALPARLADAGAAWGSYYLHDPAVMGGRIAACLAKE